MLIIHKPRKLSAEKNSLRWLELRRAAARCGRGRDLAWVEVGKLNSPFVPIKKMYLIWIQAYPYLRAKSYFTARIGAHRDHFI